ncbi:MAG: winged helix-turn-helix transcriptional regulator [Bacteroidetes bacterium]|nr:winged helix-turn-helix transcriptional regulator [Bacteroidota bacterium]
METRRDIFQAIADPTRRAIIGLLAFQAMTPGAIAANFDSSRQTISKHIQILTECHIVKQEQVGREIYYQINPKKIKEVADWANQYSQFWNEKFNSLDKYFNIAKTKKVKSKIK